MSHFSLMVRIDGSQLLDNHDDFPETVEQMLAPYEEDPKKDGPNGEKGYWKNPNAQWNWWQIGGQWTGHFPIVETATRRIDNSDIMRTPANPHTGDAVLIPEIDMEKVNSIQAEHYAAFVKEYKKFLITHDDGGFLGIHSTLIRFGLLTVKQNHVGSTLKTICIPWRGKVKEDDKRKDWTDVVQILTETELERFKVCFNPLHTHAILDKNGWKDPGKMHMFGMSEETPESYLKWCNEFNDWMFVQAKPHDMFVVVDCYI